VTDAREFLGIQRLADDLHWRLAVGSDLSTPGDFLFGGCGLGAALVALEAASGRPTVWATAQYLSYAPTGSGRWPPRAATSPRGAWSAMSATGRSSR
jgi:hypothetical protein